VYTVAHRALDIKSPFLPAAVHVSEHALAHRDFETAGRYNVNLRDLSRFDLARGDYPRVVASGGLYAFYAQVLLEQTPTGTGWPHDLWRYARGEPGAFDALWPGVSTAASNAMTEQLTDLLEIAVISRDASHLAIVLAHARQHKLRDLPRFELLAKPILDAPIDRSALTTRDAKLAEAVDAEIAGDAEKAAALFSALVADPSSRWSYPERAALVRALRATGRSAEARRICEDARRPAVFRMAWVPLRRLCVTERTPAR
jgi:hypothetical protein